MAPLGRMASSTLLVCLLAVGCGAKARPMAGSGDGPGASADAAGGGHDGPRGSDRAPDAAERDVPPAPAVEGGRDGAAAPDVPAQDGAASDRGGRIPRPPQGAVPPCAPDAMAVHGRPCPYPVLVTCTPSGDARPRQVCYCFAPPFDGKWFCQEEGGDRG